MSRKASLVVLLFVLYCTVSSWASCIVICFEMISCIQYVLTLVFPIIWSATEAAISNTQWGHFCGLRWEKNEQKLLVLWVSVLTCKEHNFMPHQQSMFTIAAFLVLRLYPRGAYWCTATLTDVAGGMGRCPVLIPECWRPEGEQSQTLLQSAPVGRSETKRHC